MFINKRGHKNFNFVNTNNDLMFLKLKKFLKYEFLHYRIFFYENQFYKVNDKS